jgi:O-antigen ligase
VAAPAIAVSWGFEDGRLAFVRYREPKLIAMAVLGWTLVSVVIWRFRTQFCLGDIRRVVGKPPMPILAVFLGYLMTTGIWVLVPQNFWYELNQYLLLFIMLVALLMWSERDPSVARTLRSGLVASLAVVTVVGLIQAAVPLSFLSPINPEIGSPHPSFMGYKNPVALAVLGQIFLLAWLVFDRATPGIKGWRRILLPGGLLAAELVYLMSLGSRTSIMALLVATLFLVGLGWAHNPSLKLAVLGLSVGGALLVILAATLVVSEDNRRRAASMMAVIKQPASYLESDRGTYLLNTLNMVRHNPMGVGLGDWQTHYPIYRLHDPTRSFTPDFQVRRAHSDHVQFLGETGWPGLLLWGTLLLTLVWITSREFFKTGRHEPLFVSAQLVAFAAAMTTDYVIEMPYHKAQFFLVVFLAIQTCRPRQQIPPPNRSRISPVIAIAMTFLALCQIAFHIGLARKNQLAAHLETSYAADLQIPTDSEAGTRVLPFSRSYALGSRFAAMHGHSKTFHKDWLILSHSALMLDRRDVALVAASRSLDLHPYYPPAYLLMSHLENDPEVARQWLRGYEDLMRGPTSGCVDSPLRRLGSALP